MTLGKFCVRIVGPTLAVLFILGYIALGTLLVIVASCTAKAAPTPPQEPKRMWACFVPEEQIYILGISDSKIKEKRYFGIISDRNKDGKIDLLMLYEVDQHGGPNEYPVAYFIDDDFDGAPDRAFKDTKQHGHCVDMVPIPLDYFLYHAHEGETTSWTSS